CLTALDAQTAPCSVLVVDNHSTDGTIEMLESEFPDCRVIRLSRNEGFSRAVNSGIQAAETPYIALLNNDAVADPCWIESGLRAFDQFPEYDFFASRMINYFDRNCLDSAGDRYMRTGLPLKRGFGEPANCYMERQPVLGASAGAAFYRRKLFEKIGLFDEDFYMYLEDVDLSLRAQLAGSRCLYLPEAVVYHMEAASDPSRPPGEALDSPSRYFTPERVYWITRNRWLLMVTYQPVGHLPWLVFGWGKSLLFHLLKGGFTKAFLGGIFAGIRASGRAFEKRKELAMTRKLSRRELCLLMKTL
ncbi:MAG TPA: glycosyltransferase family 2 protein, partial [Acidobacteriota bacterium]|nr:glycosyltransferase family 2 protein [Acidobacteriota bacterium]